VVIHSIRIASREELTDILAGEINEKVAGFVTS
jgi:hypothetical protein